MGVFEDLEVFHDAEAGHVELLFQLRQGLSVALAQTVQKRAAGGVVQGFEDRVHGRLIRDSIVT
jgi:hypothetical protein